MGQPRFRIVWTAAPSRRALAGPLLAALRRFLAALEAPAGELSLSLVGNRSMRRLNRLHRGIDRTTDVLSFPAAHRLPAPGSTALLGDLVIAVPVARVEARRHGKTLAAELELYAVHGLLHLLGHDHVAPGARARMARAELALLGDSGLIERPPTRAPPRGRGPHRRPSV